MKLRDMLKTPGEYVWRFTTETKYETFTQAADKAHRTVQRPQFAHVTMRCRGMLLVSYKPPYTSEPVMLVTVSHEPSY